jgi:uncharacterized protein (TIGR03086 family)
MDTDAYLATADVFRTVLAGVRVDQLDDPTPCEPFAVAELIDKAIGHQEWMRAALHDGQPPSRPPRAPVDYRTVGFADAGPAFDASVAAMVDELRADGAMDRTVQLAPTLTFSGAEMLVLAVRNLLQYSWDLAKATGQSTDLAPELATELLDISRTKLVPQRGEGGFFGPEFVPPADAPPADALAGFLGRTV